MIKLALLHRRGLPGYCHNFFKRQKLERLFARDYVRLIGKLKEKQCFTHNTIGIRGGDQVFAQGTPSSWLSEIHDGAPRLTYAASTDWVAKQSDPLWRSFISNVAKNFTALGLREDAGVSLVRSFLPNWWSVAHVADPVQLLQVDEYRKIEAENNVFSESTLFCYLLNISHSEQLYIHALRKLSQELKCDLKILGLQGTEEFVPKECAVIFSPIEFLRALDDSKYILTNSYHGTLLSIIYHKPFLFVPQSSSAMSDGNVRQRELLGNLGLGNRILDMDDDVETIKERISEPCDWSSVDAAMDRFRAKSIEWLWQALHKCNKEV